MTRSHLWILVMIVCGVLPTSFALGQDAEKAFLKSSEGTWKAELTMFVPGSDQTMKSTGTETNELIGDSFLVSKFEGEFDGQPFEGVGLTGYDATANKMVNHWVDSMSSTVTNYTGSYDESTKTATLTGKDQMGEGKHVTEVKDEKTRIFTMYSKFQGSDEYVKVMEIKYTKQ